MKQLAAYLLLQILQWIDQMQQIEKYICLKNVIAGLFLKSANLEIIQEYWK